MGKSGRVHITSRERAELRAIEAELGVMRIGEASATQTVLPSVRQLLDTEVVLLVSPVERAGGVALERLLAAGSPAPGRFARIFGAFLVRAPTRFAWYDIKRPEAAQRNKVIEAHDVIPPGELEQSAIYREVLVPLGVQNHRQPRILLCDGPSLLGWFGAFHPGPVEPRLKNGLARIAPAMRRRLSIERRLNGATTQSSALATTLEHLGAPAFLVSGTGAILQCNAAGRGLLERDGAGLPAALRDSIAGRPSALTFEVNALRDSGTPAAYLMILRSTSTDLRLWASVDAAAHRWSLTPRQRAVLEHVVRGAASSTIAAALGITARAVELHLTAIFDRAGAESRADLVARVLLGR